MLGSEVQSAAVTFLLVLEAEQAGPGHLFVLSRPLARLQPIAGLRAAREAAPGLSPGARGQRGRRRKPRALQRLPPRGPVAAAARARFFAGARRRQQRWRLLLLIALSLLLLRVIPLAHVHSPGLSEHSRGSHGSLTPAPTRRPRQRQARDSARAHSEIPAGSRLPSVYRAPPSAHALAPSLRGESSALLARTSAFCAVLCRRGGLLARNSGTLVLSDGSQMGS